MTRTEYAQQERARFAFLAPQGAKSPQLHFQLYRRERGGLWLQSYGAMPPDVAAHYRRNAAACLDNCPLAFAARAPQVGDVLRIGRDRWVWDVDGWTAATLAEPLFVDAGAPPRALACA